VNPANALDCLKRSDDLHTRVQSWIRGDASSREPFERLALDIARFQAEYIPGYARLVQVRGGHLDDADRLPPVPTEAFRLSRIAVHGADADQVRYATSGTTSGSRGIHAMRRTDTYRASAVTWARAALLPAASSNAAVVALLPAGTSDTSSLSAMAQMFMDEFEPSDRAGMANSEDAWLMSDPDSVVAALKDHLRRARSSKMPLLVVATALALVHLLDTLGDETLDIWPHTIVMPTGGFKGKALDVSLLELRSRAARALSIKPDQVVGEYGMTELGSQLYEGWSLRAGTAAVPGVYYPPPWLKVAAVDAETLTPVEPGMPGLARFIDLANVDSAVCIVTQDIVRAHGDGFELLGRQPGAHSRGCSLSTEEWLSAHADT
jgi:hypothetical protein